MFDFSRTHWSLVTAAGRDRPPEGDELHAWQAGWAYLRKRFDPAMRTVARRTLRVHGGSVVTPDQEEDVVQEFFRLCLEKEWLRRAAPQFGRFRTFVFVLVRRFTRKYVDWMRAQKRAPQGGWVSLESVLEGFDPRAPQGEDDDESLADWVRCLLRTANEGVRRRNVDYARINEEVLRDPGVTNLELVDRLGWSANWVAVRKFRGKEMLRKGLQRALEQTVASQADLSAEYVLLRPLFEPYGIVVPESMDG